MKLDEQENDNFPRWAAGVIYFALLILGLAALAFAALP